MAQDLDAARFVPLAAAAVGLDLPPEDVDAVIGAFAVLVRVAGPLMAFALPEDVVAAAIFTPNGVP